MLFSFRRCAAFLRLMCDGGSSSAFRRMCCNMRKQAAKKCVDGGNPAEAHPCFLGGLCRACGWAFSRACVYNIRTTLPSVGLFPTFGRSKNTSFSARFRQLKSLHRSPNRMIFVYILDHSVHFVY